jgi:negative regulator of flagellin synthesis FlgM
MDIPGGNEFRIKSRSIQDRIKVSGDSSTKKSTGSSAASATPSDTTEISSQASAIQQAGDSVKSSPELVRQEKVNQIKNALENGTFQIDSQKVAEKLLQNAIQESDFLG